MANFENALTSNVQMKIPLNLDGNIATSGQTYAGEKAWNIDGISATATLADSNAVFSAFTTICNTSFDSLTAKKTTVQGVEY